MHAEPGGAIDGTVCRADRQWVSAPRHTLPGGRTRCSTRRPSTVTAPALTVDTAPPDLPRSIDGRFQSLVTLRQHRKETCLDRLSVGLGGFIEWVAMADIQATEMVLGGRYHRHRHFRLSNRGRGIMVWQARSGSRAALDACGRIICGGRRFGSPLRADRR
jgi:hypothetical protein